MINKSDKNMQKNWYTVAEAASILSVSSQTVRRRIDSGKLESKKEGRRLYVKIDDDKVLKQNDNNRLSDNYKERHSYEFSLWEQKNQMLQEKVNNLKERIRELETDKGFLLDQIRAKDEQLEKKDGQIEEKDRVINQLIPRALPKPKRSIGEKIKGLFRRQDTKQLQST